MMFYRYHIWICTCILFHPYAPLLHPKYDLIFLVWTQAGHKSTMLSLPHWHMLTFVTHVICVITEQLYIYLIYSISFVSNIYVYANEELELELEHHIHIPVALACRLTMSSNWNIFRVTGPLCGNSPVTGEFSSQRPVTRTFDVLSKHSWGWWFETPSCLLWRQRNEQVRCMRFNNMQLLSSMNKSTLWLLLCRHSAPLFPYRF